MASRRSRAFCKALHQEIGDDPQRWTTITAVADRLGIDQDKARRWRPSSTSKPRPGGRPRRDARAGRLAAGQEALGSWPGFATAPVIVLQSVQF